MAARNPIGSQRPFAINRAQMLLDDRTILPLKHASEGTLSEPLLKGFHGAFGVGSRLQLLSVARDQSERT